MQGEFVTFAMQGNFGKPRPGLVVQADHFDEYATRHRVAGGKHTGYRVVVTHYGSTERGKRFAADDRVIQPFPTFAGLTILVSNGADIDHRLSSLKVNN